MQSYSIGQGDSGDDELGLEVGMQATARVKSTSVHIDRT